MNHIETRYNRLFLLSIVGLGVAVLSALEGHLQGLASFCSFFGDGCRETGTFRLLGISMWLWGTIYYVSLAGGVLFARPAVFWLVMTGLGAELSLIWIMVSMKLICIFCLLNALVIVLLVGLCLDKTRIWQAMAVSLLILVVSGLLLSRNFSLHTQDLTSSQGETVVAKVGDETISVLELESPLASRIYKLQHEIYQLKREQLEERIDDILLRKAAKQKGIPVQQLVDSILSGGIVVSKEEVDRFYWQNSSRWTSWAGTQEELLNQIRKYLEGQKTRQVIKDHIKPLRDQYPVTIYLRDPPLPFSKIAIGDSPVWGPLNAGVTIVEFSDYLCPACRAAHDNTKRIRKIYAGKIRWVFKDFPLERHQGAGKLAEAARCAGEQGKFWEFQDRLFASRVKPDPVKLDEYAKQLGMDVSRFNQCLETRKYGAQVVRDIEAAREAGVSSTPTFIINGKLKPGSPPLDDFIQLIDGELKKTDPLHSAK